MTTPEKLTDDMMEQVSGGTLTKDEALEKALAHAHLKKDQVDYIKKVELDIEIRERSRRLNSSQIQFHKITSEPAAVLNCSRLSVLITGLSSEYRQSPLILPSAVILLQNFAELNTVRIRFREQRHTRPELEIIRRSHNSSRITCFQ